MSNVSSGAVSADQLKEILATVIAEARKPVITEKDIREQEQAQQSRLQQSDLVKEEARNKKFNQDNCTHLRKDGSCRAVLVRGSGPDVEDLIICQGCQDITRRSTEPAEFLRLFQLAAGSSDIIF
jgi:hypothetical protein